jgi:hypothetical protein
MNDKFSKFLIKVPRADGTTDAQKYRKDCPDFECLDDGTIVGECKYCNLSLVCRQVDIVNGQTIPMESHYLPVVDPRTGEVVEWQYFCTGMHDLRPYRERLEDDKAN